MHMVNVDGAATTTSFPATNTQSIPICSLEHSVMHPVHSRADLGALTASSQHLLNFSNAQQPPHKVATRNGLLIFPSRRNSNTCNFLSSRAISSAFCIVMQPSLCRFQSFFWQVLEHDTSDLHPSHHLVLFLDQEPQWPQSLYLIATSSNSIWLLHMLLDLILRSFSITSDFPFDISRSTVLTQPTQGYSHSRMVLANSCCVCFCSGSFSRFLFSLGRVKLLHM